MQHPCTVYTEENFPGEYRKYERVKKFLEERCRDIFYPHCHESVGRKKGAKCVCLAELSTGGCLLTSDESNDKRTIVLNVELRRKVCPILPFSSLCRILTEFQNVVWNQHGYIERSDIIYFMNTFSPYKAGIDTDWWKLRNYPDKPALCNDAMNMLFGQSIERFFDKDAGDLTCHHVLETKKRKRANKYSDEQPMLLDEPRGSKGHDMICHRYRKNKPLCDFLLSYVSIWEEQADLTTDLIGGFTHKFVERSHVMKKYTEMFGNLVDTSTNTVNIKISTLMTSFLKKALVVVASSKFTGKDVENEKNDITKDGRVLVLRGKKAYKSTAKEWVYHDMDGYAIKVPEDILKTLLNVYHDNYYDDGYLRNVQAMGPMKYELREMIASQDSNDNLYHISSRKGGFGMAELFGKGCYAASPDADISEAVKVFKTRQPGLCSLVNSVYHKCRDMIDSIEGKFSMNYTFSHDFGYMMTRMDLSYVSFQLDHLDFSPNILELAQSLEVYLFVGLFPIEKEGMWIHILPEHPGFDDNEDIDTERTWKVYLLGSTNESTQKGKSKQNKSDGKVTEDERPVVEGRWVFVPYGSLLLIPRTLYYGGIARTSITGNTRYYFNVYAVPDGKEKEFFENETFVREKGSKSYLVSKENTDTSISDIVAARNYEAKNDETELGWLLSRVGDRSDDPTIYDGEDKLLSLQDLTVPGKKKKLLDLDMKYNDLAEMPLLKYVLESQRGFAKNISL